MVTGRLIITTGTALSFWHGSTMIGIILAPILLNIDLGLHWNAKYMIWPCMCSIYTFANNIINEKYIILC